MSSEKLKIESSENLSLTRSIVHRAVQHLTKAARANLPAQGDDSHSSVVWEGTLNGFTTQPMNGKRIGLTLSPFALLVVDEKDSYSELLLAEQSYDDVEAWLDQELSKLGLKSAASVDLPYALPADVAAVSVYPPARDSENYLALAAWFELAHQNLTELINANTYLTPGPSPVRCWPHHFDIASYIALESGDAETARGIGVGMSPGDETYAEPYFYINPWPYLDAKALPAATAPGHWHTDGFVGQIATASEVLATPDANTSVRNFLEKGFDLSLKAQGF